MNYKNPNLEDYKGIIKWAVIIIIAAVLVFNSFYTINEQEAAVVTTFGIASASTESGLHFKIPFVQQVTKVDTTIKGFPIGYDAHTNNTIEDESLMITSDFNFVNVDFYVEYRVTDPVKALYASENYEAVLKTIAQSSIRAEIGSYPVDSVITTGKSEIQSKLPEDVKRLFPRTLDTGIKHGTVTVMVKSEGYEVTTYRVDGEYTDGRHPESVSFTASLDEDLKRRDFTINALVYNEATGVTDLFGGTDDLENKIIRCVGVAEERFGEDALRILRAIRFSAQLGFDIEEDTYTAAVKLGANLAKVSAERIKAELDKTLMSDNPGHICLLKTMGLDKVILPDL